MDANGWQPIETAPKDGTWIMACIQGMHKDGYPYVPSVVMWNGFWDDGRITEFTFEDWEPTHWMPLPPPPGGTNG